MTKEEKDNLRNRVTPYFHRFRDNSEWREAFLMYNAIHGTNLKPNCGKCFNTVREWLKR